MIMLTRAQYDDTNRMLRFAGRLARGLPRASFQALLRCRRCWDQPHIDPDDDKRYEPKWSSVPFGKMPDI